jgi:hypothetical protein
MVRVSRTRLKTLRFVLAGYLATAVCVLFLGSAAESLRSPDFDGGNPLREVVLVYAAAPADCLAAARTGKSCGDGFPVVRVVSPGAGAFMAVFSRPVPAAAVKRIPPDIKRAGLLNLRI